MYGGDLVLQASDDYGNIQIVDFQQRFRSLHFDSKVQQSAMLLEKPDLLVHKYTQAMALPFCCTNINSTLMLGLGGGSIAKFILSNFPDSKLDAVELRSIVSQLATQYFSLPEENDRFRIFNMDVYDWLNNQQERNVYDIIMIDMFLTHTNGEAKATDISEYLDKILSLLSPDGVIVYNHLGDNILEDNFYKSLTSSQLEINTIKLEYNNTIVFSTRNKFNKDLTDSDLFACEYNYTSPFKEYFDKLEIIKQK